MKALIDNFAYYSTNKRMQNNSYVILSKENAIVIDPSWNGSKIINFLKERKIKNIIMLITHAHYDHLVDLDKIYNEYPDCYFYISKHESIHLKQKSKNLIFKCPIEIPKEKVIEIDDVDSVISIYDIDIKTIYTPGHSKGSITYIIDNLFFTGDFIFSNCIGRLDLPTGSIKDMNKSINRFYDIPQDDSLICPGHNEISLYKIVKVYNDEMNEYKKSEYGK